MHEGRQFILPLSAGSQSYSVRLSDPSLPHITTPLTTSPPGDTDPLFCCFCRSLIILLIFYHTLNVCLLSVQLLQVHDHLAPFPIPPPPRGDTDPLFLLVLYPTLYVLLFSVELLQVIVSLLVLPHPHPSPPEEILTLSSCCFCWSLILLCTLVCSR